MELNVLTCADILGTTASRSLLLKGLNVPRCQADILGRIANGAEITRAIICG